MKYLLLAALVIVLCLAWVTPLVDSIKIWLAERVERWMR